MATSGQPGVRPGCPPGGEPLSGRRRSLGGARRQRADAGAGCEDRGGRTLRTRAGVALPRRRRARAILSTRPGYRVWELRRARRQGGSTMAARAAGSGQGRTRNAPCRLACRRPRGAPLAGRGPPRPRHRGERRALFLGVRGGGLDPRTARRIVHERLREAEQPGTPARTASAQHGDPPPRGRRRPAQPSRRYSATPRPRPPRSTASRSTAQVRLPSGPAARSPPGLAVRDELGLRHHSSVQTQAATGRRRRNFSPLASAKSFVTCAPSMTRL